jgi:hypothetical protein
MDELYINIGTVKCCLFVKMSTFLLRAIVHNPLLYFAVEEALECAKIEYYCVGVLTFSQLLNVFNCETPASRHAVAHEILRTRPTKQTFEEVVEAFKSAASEQSDRESGKCRSVADYKRNIVSEWEAFIKNLHGI